MLRVLILTVTEAGGQLEILQANGLILMLLRFLNQSFLFFNFLRYGDMGKVDTRTRFVHGVDGLVGEITVGHIAVGQAYASFQRLVRVSHVMMLLVFILDIPENLQSLFR